MSSKIEWTEESWNPVIGCSKVSPGCANCYAERIAVRLKGVAQSKENPGKLWPYFNVTDKFGHWCRVCLASDRLNEPQRWRKSRKVFVCSMSDLFHASVPYSYIDSVWSQMMDLPQHTFQVLTKRSGRLVQWLNHELFYYDGNLTPNIWVGVSAENQRFFDLRYRDLASVSASVHFVSLGPLLGPICLNGTKPDWVIVEGESGPGARLMHPNWVRSIRDYCIKNDIPFFFKQWGEWIHESQLENKDLVPKSNKTLALKDLMDRGRVDTLDGGKTFFYRIGKKKAGRLLDGKLWDEYPEVK